MAAVVLASLTEQGHRPVRPPTLVKAYDYTSREAAAAAGDRTPESIVPNRLIADAGRPLLKTLLQAPLCYSHGGAAHGTLKSLGAWCAEKRNDLRLHFAKTGTSVGVDINATVDTWITGGLQFSNGAAYSYVVLVGTGNPSQSWARSLHSAQVGVPLLEVLLGDLKEHARIHGVAVAGHAEPVGARPRAGARWPSGAGRVRSQPGRCGRIELRWLLRPPCARRACRQPRRPWARRPPCSRGAGSR